MSNRRFVLFFDLTVYDRMTYTENPHYSAFSQIVSPAGNMH